MRFKQKESLLKSMLIISACILCVLIIFYIIAIEVRPFVLGLGVVALAALLLLPLLDNEYVFMNEDGVSLSNKRKEIWSYCWSEIEEMEFNCISRFKIVKIKPQNPKPDLGEVLWFEYGPSAKKAIELYCKIPIK